MLCPICKQEIPNGGGNTYFCPFCGTIVNEDLQSSVIPTRDKSGAEVRVYIPDEEKLFEHGRAHGRNLRECLRRKRSIGALLALFAGIVLFGYGIVYAFLYEGWAPVIMALAVVAILAYLTVREFKNRKKYKDLYSIMDDILPVSYYGNEQIFGFGAISRDANRGTVTPKVYFFECKKTDILGVEYDEPSDCHFVALIKPIRDKVDYLKIPYIFDEALIDTIYGEHTALL